MPAMARRRWLLFVTSLCFSGCAACSSNPARRQQVPIANAALPPRESFPEVLNLRGTSLDLPFDGAVIVAGPSSIVRHFAFRDQERRINVAEKEPVPGLHALKPYRRGDVEFLYSEDDGDTGWRVLATIHYSSTTSPPRIVGPKVRSIRSCRGRVTADFEGMAHERVIAVVLARVMPGVATSALAWNYPPAVPRAEFTTDAISPRDSAAVVWIDADGRFSESSEPIIVSPCE